MPSAPPAQARCASKQSARGPTTTCASLFLLSTTQRTHAEETTRRYLLIDTTSPTPHPVAAIDPYDVSRLRSHAESLSIPLALGTHVLTTHHHADHAGGNSDFLKSFPDAQIFGGSKQVEALNTAPLQHGDEIRVGNLVVRAIHTPCHTQDHICFYVEAPEGDEGEGPRRAVFTGDTLFVGGCGRFFEGEPGEMHTALNERLAGLPEDTTVWNGHEYTKSVR